jgi:RNA polymerase sigma-70 factor, ECF subfamily
LLSQIRYCDNQPGKRSGARLDRERLVSLHSLSYLRAGMATSQDAADRETLAQAASGDQRAFAKLYDRLSGPLYSLAVRMLGDANEAQDAVQDVFVQIWRCAAKYESAQSSVFSWAMLMTRSRAIDRLRARSRRLRVVASSTDDDSSIVTADASAAQNAADTIDRGDDAMRVRAILDKLPAEQRQAIELAFFSELTHHEIAAELGQPLGTIKARIRRGLLKLRKQVNL